MLFLLILFYLITVVSPVIFWLWFFLRTDRSEPEPRRALIEVFILGIFVTFLGVAVELLPEYFLAPNGISETGLLTILFVFLVGPIEEFLKYLVLKETVYYKIAFNQVYDGVIYGITLALGFSFIENTFYFIEIYSKLLYTFDFIVAVIYRGLACTLVHVVATGIIGFYLGKAKFSSNNRNIIILRGLILASLIHSIYNVFQSVPYLNLLVFFAIFIILIFFMKRTTKSDARMVWKLVVPQNA